MFTRRRILALVMLAVLGATAFLLFRPHKLFVDDPVGESLAQAFPSTTSAPAATAATTSAAAPTPISTGAFSGIAHSAVGTATVYEQDGRYVLRFEDDTDIQNGPDLYVWVLADADYDGGTPASYLDLGKLKGNVGGQRSRLDSPGHHADSASSGPAGCSRSRNSHGPGRDISFPPQRVGQRSHQRLLDCHPGFRRLRQSQDSPHSA